MATVHTLYENIVLENKFTSLLNTELETRGLMELDYSLAESAGLRKTINKYTYTGSVEKLAKGAKNTTKGVVTFVPVHHDVERFQSTVEFNDMDVMQDPNIIEVSMRGEVDLQTNKINDLYFAELAKISNTGTWAKDTTFSYDTVVDALATINREVEEGMFIIMNNAQRAEIRKDPDFKASRQGEILYKGQFGDISGLPVLFSKLVPVNTVYITAKDQIKFFVKAEGSVEQDRDIETKDNTVVYERHGVIALVDDTKSIKLTQATA